MKTNSFLSAVVFTAISFTFFACSSDDSGGGSYLGDDSSSSSGNGGSGDGGSSSSSGDNGDSGDSSSSGGSSSSSSGNGGSGDGDSSSSSVWNCDDYSSGDGSFSCGGQTYKTVEIGDQTWMAENLNYDVSGSVCHNNSSSNCTTYGRLYNWETAMAVCPNGWHLPTNEEWDKLFRYVDGDNGIESLYNSETAGRYLKATSGWNDYKIWNEDTDSYDFVSSGNGLDTYGFAALPGEYGNSDGSFYSNVGFYGLWWSASEDSNDIAYARSMLYHNEKAIYGSIVKSTLFSVRCLKD